ncbi:endoplasmic reticulum metallopeptidase 1-like [Drosophila novamexicana]|uniref:endoplasmic reticulum metallopeptidase 1-like n=1 Tax=Drosophila novamexicana TaxID=47314 RepID=UPI0011E5FB69|nr:endoplasmic reticulum metallopeptidase 1-like [Drosophila novamexicana]
MLRAIRTRFESCQNKISDEPNEAPENVSKKEVKAQVPWYYASGFLLFWVLLFFAVVLPFFYRLPTALTMEDVKKNVFIAERAYKNLYTLSNIGTKLTGSKENEIEAVNFILNELAKIEEVLLEDYFDMEVDVSQASGSFPYSTMLSMYQGVQNIAVKLTPKNSTAETYLLVNSHFDSKPFTPSAGDAGFMVVTMLEVLRVIATTNQPFEHPIVFLFNGAEEGMMQASHGFVTQHKWAPNCKAVVNLDAGGSGGREILLQSGPNHPWLVNYYKKYIKHPFATTMAEEIFQSGIIPSDTDFRQFNLYGNIPGLDMVQCINGFVYHTKYDLIDVIPRESLQNTGDNVLSLVRGLANASELRDTEAHKTGHAVFFDFLGLCFIHYSETTGIILNCSAAGAALILVFVSIWRIADVSHVSISHVLLWGLLVLTIQFISFVLGLALPIVVAYVFDKLGLSLTYYSSPLLVIGLFVCPSLIGLSLPITIYYIFQRNDKISTSYHLQLALHAHAVILALLIFGFTLFGLRSTYIFLISLIFYVISLAFNLLTTLHDRGYAWTGLLKAGQIIPFLYSSYIFYLFVIVLVPIGGRAGSSATRDTHIAFLAAAGTVLSFGFLVPLINTFRRPSFVVYCLLAITVVAMYLASFTHIGFPFRPKTNGQRVAYLEVRNKFYEYDGTLSKDESGYLFSFQDRREEETFWGPNLTGLVSIKSNCETHMMCGMPLYDYRYAQNRLQSKWLPRSEPIEPPASSKLELLSKTVLNETTVRFEFNLTGPSHMSLFIQPYEGVKISNWSFLRSYLENPPAPPLSYHIYLTYGNDSSPVNFVMEILTESGDFDFPLFQLGVSAHYIGNYGDEESVKLASSFPSYAILAEWPALYQRYIF